MGHNQSSYAEQASEQYPHYKTYTECQSKAFMMGLVSYVSGLAVIFVGQEAVRKVLPMPLGARVAMPVLGGTVVAYIWTRRRTQFCQEMWLALEEKHTSVTPISPVSGENVIPAKDGAS